MSSVNIPSRKSQNDFPVLGKKKPSEKSVSKQTVAQATPTKSHNTACMLERLRRASLPVCKTLKDIAKVIDIQPDRISKLADYANDFPYYHGGILAQYFDLTTDIDISLFNMGETLILSDSAKDIKGLFFSLTGVYKLLLLSNFTATTKLNLIKEYQSTDSLPKEDWFKVKTVINKTKYPTARMDTSLNELPFDRYIKSTIDSRYTSAVVMRLALLSGLKEDLSDLFPLIGNPVTQQLHHGCVQDKYVSRVLSKGPDSPNLSFKNQGKLVRLTKKFKPILNQYSFDFDSMLALLCIGNPAGFVRIIINDTMFVNNIPVPEPQQTGFLYMSPENKLSVGDNIDTSTRFEVAQACRIADVILAKRLIDMNWSFDSIIENLAIA